MLFFCLFLCATVLIFLSAYLLKVNRGLGCFFLSISVGLFMVAGLIFVDKESPTKSAHFEVYTALERPEFVTHASVHTRVDALAKYCAEDAAKDPLAPMLMVNTRQFFAKAYLPGEKETVLSMPEVQKVLALCAKQVGVVQDPLSTVR